MELGRHREVREIKEVCFLGETVPSLIDPISLCRVTLPVSLCHNHGHGRQARRRRAGEDR